MSLDHISVTWVDYPDNENLAQIIYFNGCEHECKGCHNKELKDLSDDREKELDILIEFLYGNKTKSNKVVLSGGDPLYIRNLAQTRKILTLNDTFDFCIYTGYSINDVKSFNIKGARFYKCGVYIDQQKDLTAGKTNEYLRFASKNQRLYDENYNLISDGNTYYFKK